MSDLVFGSSTFPSRPIPLMVSLYFRILPAVNREFAKWRQVAEAIPDAELRKQALASMDGKKFHCQGGAVYATGVAQREQADALVAWIVAFQTISDYLDNLCDRSTSLDGDDFRALHMAMLDAVCPDRSQHDYYALRTEKNDGGYLSGLVQTCRQLSAQFPSFQAVQQELQTLVQWYCDLQVHKHIRHELREQALFAWWGQQAPAFPQWLWQEFAAATGSTLGVFCLMTAATHERITLAEARAIRERYFPAICGLHIMLDYLIDREEDREGGDLNFCFYYESEQHMMERFSHIIEQANDNAKRMARGDFHHMIVEGLLALYLSDKKAEQSAQQKAASRVLLKNGPWMRTFFYWNCRLIRRLF